MYKTNHQLLKEVCHTLDNLDSSSKEPLACNLKVNPLTKISHAQSDKSNNHQSPKDNKEQILFHANLLSIYYHYNIL